MSHFKVTGDSVKGGVLETVELLSDAEIVVQEGINR